MGRRIPEAGFITSVAQEDVHAVNAPTGCEASTPSGPTKKSQSKDWLFFGGQRMGRRIPEAGFITSVAQEDVHAVNAPTGCEASTPSGPTTLNVDFSQCLQGFYGRHLFPSVRIRIFLNHLRSSR
jgi:hypothetical protein